MDRCGAPSPKDRYPFRDRNSCLILKSVGDAFEASEHPNGEDPTQTIDLDNGAMTPVAHQVFELGGPNRILELRIERTEELDTTVTPVEITQDSVSICQRAGCV